MYRRTAKDMGAVICVPRLAGAVVCTHATGAKSAVEKFTGRMNHASTAWLDFKANAGSIKAPRKLDISSPATASSRWISAVMAIPLGPP